MCSENELRHINSVNELCFLAVSCFLLIHPPTHSQLSLTLGTSATRPSTVSGMCPGLRCPVANTFRGHADSKNEAPSRGYIWGEFKGGVLKIHQPDGIRSIRSLSQWFAFDGRHYHEMTPVTDGVRFSSILFDRPKQDGQNAGSAIPGS